MPICNMDLKQFNEVADDVSRFNDIGRRGFTISICCGPSGGHPFIYSVDVVSPDWQTFEEPYAARSFRHAIEIAEKEIERRGW